MSELVGRCSKCGTELTTGGCPRCTVSITLMSGNIAPPPMREHLCCYHPTSVYYTTNPPQQIEACCHCGHRRGMGITHLSPPPIPPGHGPYYPRNFR